ncbi:MazG nucleotide pyrophosphohydrolase domain-containing protein [Pseudofrankia sp. EUN1h]|uniref:MazG nucleotide pyrophosphohydrolase domain-containing protein n=1 Tax=Pseudofrankia sp. EUN1h TaxID=1834515 RepID=UPI000234CB52|nr:MazG nucleotide pyrophosphohydrolase domain-containing protein [Pseudofrankia sp. EUN1h]OHV37077.1 nucleotide pyrophosphohydrolase [Pseudofrankia sp. EUN1h]
MNLDQVLNRAIDVRNRYGDLNRHEGRREWCLQDYMLGFVGDVGDLAKLVMAQDGARDVQDLRGAIEHELSDCLWSVVILADRLHVDLGDAFSRTMDDLECRIAAQLDGGG